MKTEYAIFAAGCFWGVEETFRKLPGVVDTAVGYCGGNTENPTYQDVCSGRTGHAEAVQVTFDPAVTSFDELLQTFWSLHDPTQVNRQGPDVGTQYRSGIFYLDAVQEQAAHDARDALDKSGRYGRPVATEIVPAGKFWMAEDYHQQYEEKRKNKIKAGQGSWSGLFR